jgi:RsmE family RNA methyltransferase
VNLVLLEAHELEAGLPAGDRRVQHVLNVLRRQPGESFDAGLVNGPRGKARLVSVSAERVSLTFEPTTAAPDVAPIALLVGLCRPQTARDVLRDATTLGVGRLHFVSTERSEPSYARSSLWSSGEWRRHVLAGAEQAFDTAIPEVRFEQSLAEALAKLAARPTTRGRSCRLALDNYEAASPLREAAVSPDDEVVLAIGPERGWSAADRTCLRASAFELVHLGSRVLRTETAVVAALTLTRTKLGLA